MGVNPWSGSVHHLAALNQKIEAAERALEELYVEREWLIWQLDNGDHSE